MKKIPIGTYHFGPFHKTVKLSALPHMHVLGISGSGKSRLLARLFLSLYEAGIATTLIDPHGDLSRLVLSHLVAKGVYRKPEAFERILYLDIPAAERAGRYLPFNILKQHLPIHTIASNFKDAMHRAFPELEQIAPANFDTLLPRAIRAMIVNDVPLTRLEKFFINKQFRNGLLEIFNDEDAVSFFQDAYEEMRKTEQLNYAGSVMRRGVQLNDLPVLKYAFEQKDNVLNFRRIMDEGKFVIINLALPDSDAAHLFGSLMTVGMEQAAKGRQDPKRVRTPHYLIIDEAFQFMAKSEVAFASFLSETRKYNFSLCMGHQTWSQTSDLLRGALQNVGVDVAFKQGRDDAEYTAKLIGVPDLLHVKNDPTTGGNPAYFSLWDEWELWVQAIKNLPPRAFYLYQPMHRRPLWKRLLFGNHVQTAARLKALPMPDVTVSEKLLTEIEQEYLTRYFRKPDTEQTVQRLEPDQMINSQTKTSRRKRKLSY